MPANARGEAGGLLRMKLLLRRGGMGCIPFMGGLIEPLAPGRVAEGGPKLIRLVKGPTGGAVRGASSSSMAFSSTESELVERLARRSRAEGAVGDVPVPDRPRVVTESLRRGSVAAAAIRGVGKGTAPGCGSGLVRKKLVKALEAVMEPRRWRFMSADGEIAGIPLSEDMVEILEGVRKKGRRIYYM
jgi:hypothetical protein